MSLERLVEKRLIAREKALARGDSAAAGAIRQELYGRGVLIEDTPLGTRWQLMSLTPVLRNDTAELD